MLHVHRAERADGLADALRELLADPLPDTFAAEVVAVPTRGMERWLTQRIAARLGVCANVEFPSPSALLTDAVAAASGIEDDPWRPERLVWPLLEVVEAGRYEPWLHPLAAYLAADPAHRFATVRHLAELLARYALHRPEMVRAWSAGEDAPHGAAWQSELWRRLTEALPEPDPAARLDAACARLRADPGVVALPARLSLFGLTRLPHGRLDVLRALAAARDVHLFLLHPSPALWEKLAGHPPVLRRADDPTGAAPANRLLASWGHDARELQLVLGEHASHHHPVAPGPPTQLARLQDDIRADRSTAPPAAPDRSIQVHACHGRARQVEVVRDAILHELAADPTLEPRDVIVMCPDIEAFAPLIEAAFGSSDGELRVRLADRGLRQTNPILGFAGRLLDLVGERATASQVLDLADREPVRRRFRLDDEDLGRIEAWIHDSGIRWGLDAEHRAPFKLEALPAGTWRVGLDRVLVGVAMSEDERRLFGDVLPLDDVESAAIGLAGRFAELVARLRAALSALSGPQSIAAWAAALAGAADALTATPPRDAWQRWQLQRLLDDVVAEAGPNATPLALAEVRALLGERLQGRATRASFRTGHLTVCTLMPMRSVPHRVVCLLGLDDAVFPRKGVRDGDDLMLDDPHVGDRDARTEDRQLLLDALMAATDRLIVTYTGNDERTNIACPPAVPVGELLDMVGRDVVVRHPLQPFDVRNFVPGALLPERAWSFDHVALAGARALTRERVAPGRFLEHPLPYAPGALIELEDLVRFVAHPVRAFLEKRLGLSFWMRADELEDALSVKLDPLGESRVGRRLLAARLDGVEPRPAILAEIRRGLLPPGVLGKWVIDDLAPAVEAIVRRAGDREAGTVDVRVTLDGRTLRGTVSGVHGDVLRTVTFDYLNAGHWLAARVRQLALAAAGRPFAAEIVARGRDEPVRFERIEPLPADAARRRLAALVDLYDRGMREPLPLARDTSAAYAAGQPAEALWESSWSRAGEHADAEHELVHGGRIGFAELLEDAPRADERWDPDERTRFGQYARRLWAAVR